jgi:hypothetical protein
MRQPRPPSADAQGRLAFRAATPREKIVSSPLGKRACPAHGRTDLVFYGAGALLSWWAAGVSGRPPGQQRACGVPPGYPGGVGFETSGCEGVWGAVLVSKPITTRLESGCAFA